MKNFIFLALAVFGVLSADVDANTLLNTTDQYILFVNRIASGENVRRGEASAILDPDCRKIFNGNLITTDSESFVMDLLSVYRNIGGWKVIPIEIIDATKDGVIVFRSMIETQNLGVYTAIVILRFNDEGLISEINEVFSFVENQYEFCTD